MLGRGVAPGRGLNLSASDFAAAQNFSASFSWENALHPRLTNMRMSEEFPLECSHARNISRNLRRAAFLETALPMRLLAIIAMRECPRAGTGYK